LLVEAFVEKLCPLHVQCIERDGAEPDPASKIHVSGFSFDPRWVRTSPAKLAGGLGADITCGAAWARTGAVTLDTNTISICTLLAGPGGTPLGPTGVPLFAFLLPSSASTDQRSVANALDTFVGNGGTLPLAFLNLFNLSPSQLGSAFTQLSGEAATGAAQAGTQAMNSFLSLVTNPFDTNRPFADNRQLPTMFVKAAPLGAAPDPRRWGIWGPRAMAAKPMSLVTRWGLEATTFR